MLPVVCAINWIFASFCHFLLAYQRERETLWRYMKRISNDLWQNTASGSRTTIVHYLPEHALEHNNLLQLIFKCTQTVWSQFYLCIRRQDMECNNRTLGFGSELKCKCLENSKAKYLMSQSTLCAARRNLLCHVLHSSPRNPSPIQ